MRIIVLLSHLVLSAPLAAATPQFPEYLTFDGKQYAINEWPLRSWLDQNPGKKKLFPSRSSACWRGSIGFWTIEDGRLFLDRLHDGGLTEASEYGNRISLSDVFGTQQERIPATWYSGVIRIGLKEKAEAADDTAFAIFPDAVSSESITDVYFTIENGLVAATHKVNHGKDGAFLSRADRYWVYSTADPPTSHERWTDLRALQHQFPEFKSDTAIKTRGRISTHDYEYIEEYKAVPKPRDKINLSVPATLRSQYATIRIVCPSTLTLPDDAAFVEVSGRWNKDHIAVTKLRPLKPGETIHHPQFAATARNQENGN